MGRIISEQNLAVARADYSRLSSEGAASFFSSVNVASWPIASFRGEETNWNKLVRYETRSGHWAARVPRSLGSE
jgi:hypothetical protein